MKSITLALMGLLVGASAWACPDLRGTYTCTYENGSETLTVDQMEQNGTTYYIINGDTVPADGQLYPIADDESQKNQFIMFSCKGEPSKFALNYTGDLYEGGQLQGHISAEALYSKDSAGSLVIEETGTFSAVDGNVYPWSEQTSCPAQ